MFFGGDGARDVFNLAGNRELDKVIYLVIRFTVVQIKHQNDVKFVAKHRD